MENDKLKRMDQIRFLEAFMIFTDSEKWNGGFAYPGCGDDLVTQGLITEPGQITIAGRATLFLLGKGDDPTDSQAVQTINIPLKNKQ